MNRLARAISAPFRCAQPAEPSATPGRILADLPPQLFFRRLLEASVVSALVGLTIVSAIVTKEAGSAPPLARVVLPVAAVDPVAFDAAPLPVSDPLVPVAAVSPIKVADIDSEHASEIPEGAKVYPAGIRFFNGRPIRAVRTIRMKVTAYTPDADSCGDSADGLTATLHHVTTNDHRLVASDPRVLPYGSMISIPGYDDGNVVPVLDCGGAIKGNRLDVLYASNTQAKRWGVKYVDVVVWGYADGTPRDNPRKLR